MAYGNVSCGQQLYLLLQNRDKRSSLRALRGEGHLGTQSRQGTCPNPRLQGLLAASLCLASTPRTARVIFHLALFQQPLTSICSLMTSADGLNKAVRSTASSEPPQEQRMGQREEGMSHSKGKISTTTYLNGTVTDAQISDISKADFGSSKEQRQIHRVTQKPQIRNS